MNKLWLSAHIYNFQLFLHSLAPEERWKEKIPSLGSPARNSLCSVPLPTALPEWKTQGTWNVVALGLDTCREVSVLWDGVAVVIQGREFGRNFRVPRHQHWRQHWERQNREQLWNESEQKNEEKPVWSDSFKYVGCKRGLVKGQDLVFASGIRAAGEHAVYSQLGMG